MQLTGKIAIVTGSTKGIGASIARVFAKAGARVVVTGRSVKVGEDVAGSIRGEGHEATFIAADLATEAGVKRLIDATVERFGGVDILVNNAAAVDYIGEGGDRPVTETTTEHFDYIMKVGIYAPFWCCKHAIPEMQRRGGGAIVNISSIISESGMPSTPAYTCSKAALNGLTRQIAVDYAKDNIRVNCLLLGFILSADLAEHLTSDAAFTQSLKDTLLSRRLGMTEDVANAALFLAADENLYINGVCLPVDGGVQIRSALPDFSKLLGGLHSQG